MDSEDTISSSEEMSSDESDCLDCGSWGLELTAEEEVCSLFEIVSNTNKIELLTNPLL